MSLEVLQTEALRESLTTCNRRSAGRDALVRKLEFVFKGIALHGNCILFPTGIPGVSVYLLRVCFHHDKLICFLKRDTVRTTTLNSSKLHRRFSYVAVIFVLVAE